MAAAASHKSETNVKETIESILVAFILAFIFRCFVVEAFVIPTGSMAPTLLGAHMSFRCPDCGYRFTVGYSDDSDPYSTPEQADKVYSIFCPNCGIRIPRQLAHDPANDAENPAVHYGDRILVMKYVYLLNEPHRWDVVVFKTPDNPGAFGDYTVNYIKRLAGKPGERLFVAEGDLYVSPDTGKPPVPSDFKVQTKPAYAQDALWRIVYDADYVPIGLPRTNTGASGETITDPAWQQPWQQSAGSGWSNNDPSHGVTARQFAFTNPDGAGTLKFNDQVDPNKAALTDFVGYDQTRDQSIRRSLDGRVLDRDTFARPSYGTRDSEVSSVSDLKLSFVVDSLSGNGTLTSVLGKGDTKFHCEIAADHVKLTKFFGAASKVIANVPIQIGHNSAIVMQNVDYRVSVLVDGREIIATTPADYAPDVAQVIARTEANEPSPAGWTQIDADHVTAKISHVQLWRDVYYRDRNGPVRAIADDFPHKVVQLGKDEYFVMGDNSYMSSDARYWQSRVDLDDENLHVDAGRVPGRFLLGRAFFVYWPAGFRPISGVPPLMPNFGDMRFIR
ncbi:MAG: S26 family signal peptidase [Tepidisphaeraceae bacterium]